MSSLLIVGRRNAAKHIREKTGYPMSPATLRAYQRRGDGPEYQKFGAHGPCVFAPDKLTAWVLGRLTTPETPPPTSRRTSTRTD